MDDEVEIDLMEIFYKLLKKWKFILIVSCIFGMVGVVSALMMERKWGCTITLAPESQQSGAGSLSSITSMLGVRASGSSADALNITLFPEICKSTPFLTQLFDVELTPYVSLEDQMKGVVAQPTTVFKHITKEDQPKKGLARLLEKLGKKEVEFDESIVNPVQLTPKQAAVVKYLAANISATVDNKTGITTISAVMDDRLMATQLADTVCSRLQDYVIEYRTKKANEDYQYYVKLADEAHDELVKAQAAYAASVDYDRSVILQSVNSEKERLQQEASLANEIYSQMAQQREMAKAKIQESKPVYAVVQPATVPQNPMNSRKTRVLIFGFLGFFLSCAWAGFGEDFWHKMKDDLKEKMDEEA